MTTPAAPALGTLGELRASGHHYKELKQELRDNLLTKLASGEERFPGIVGFDDTVLPDLERARWPATTWCCWGSAARARRG